MRTERWIVGALVLCTLTACKHWDWAQTPNAAKEDDCKQYSVQESLGFYEKLLPPRGFYQVYALAEAADETTVPTRLPYSFIVFRVRDARFPDKKDPVVERIIGPVRSKEEWIDLFSVFRRYASSPPAGYYCWQDDCRGKYSPAGDPDPRDPYPPEIPDHAGITVPSGLATSPVPQGAYGLRDGPARSQGTGGSGFEPGTGGAGCNFVPREKTVLSAELLEKLRASASRVGQALEDVPEVPGWQKPPPVPEDKSAQPPGSK